MLITKFVNVKIMNFKKVDKARRGGGSDHVDKVFLLNLGTSMLFFWLFYYIFSSI